jgi:hypothetical protein
VNIPLAAGMIPTGLFVFSVLPMLGKAWRTKDLSSPTRHRVRHPRLRSVRTMIQPEGPLTEQEQPA